MSIRPADPSGHTVPGSALRLAYYGDDFTGATDALEVLASAGWRCALFLQTPDARTLARHPQLDAIGIAGDSRAMTPAQMEQALPPVLQWMMDSGAPVLHYKVCSTFDSAPHVGSIGRVIALARQRLVQRCVAIVAATPRLARYCLFGHLFARAATDGQVHRIDRHPIMRVHPVTPMDEADLALHIARQHPLRIDKATMVVVDGGAEVLVQRIRTSAGEGADAVLVDGLHDAHMRTAGLALRALGSHQAPVFVVGGSGVEHAMTAAWQDEPGQARTPPDLHRPAVAQVLALSGSASALSAQQIAQAVHAGFHEVALDALALADGTPTARDAAIAEAVQDAVQAWQDGRSVILHSARGPDDPRIAALRQRLVDRRLDAEAARQVSGPQLGEQLGRIVLAITRAVRVQRLLISGGDTSSAIGRVLDVQAVVMAAALSPGAPLCRVLESRHVAGMEIAFKGGQMGAADFFDQARRAGPAG